MRKPLKILDWYVIVSFIQNYLISFMVMVGMYVVLDMVFNFDEIASVQSVTGGAGPSSILQILHDIGDYYFYQCFLIFVHMSGMIPVVAAAFTLMRLSRFNELSAFLASGVPLLRVALPIVIVAVILNALLIVDQEVFLPRMIPKLTRSHNDIHGVAQSTYPVQAMQDDTNGLLWVSEYRPNIGNAQATMKIVDVIYRDDEGHTTAHLKADGATWDPASQSWKLSNGQIVRGLLENETRSEIKQADFYKSNITPDEIALYRSSDFVELLSSERIDELIARPKSYGLINLVRVKHWRFTQPFMNIVMLLLAIPAVLTREPGKLKAAATKCLAWTGVAMASIFMMHQLAGHPPQNMSVERWMALMACMPILIFLPIAVHLLDRMHKHGS